MKATEKKLRRTRFHGNGSSGEIQTTSKDDVSMEDIFQDLEHKDKLEIRCIANEIESISLQIKNDFFLIGKLLTLAKKYIPHGMFEDWILLSFNNEELVYSTEFSRLVLSLKKSPS